MRVLALLFLVLPAAADVFVDDIRVLTSYNSASTSVSSSTSTCIANRPTSCGYENGWTGNCGLIEKRTDCWCDGLCFALYSSNCCEDSPTAYAVMVIAIIVIVAAIAMIPIGIWMCIDSRCPRFPRQRAKVDPGCDATQKELMLTTKGSTTPLPGLCLRV